MKLFLKILIVSVLALFINCREKEPNGNKIQKNNQDSIKTVEDTLVYNLMNYTLLQENEIYKECNYLFDRIPIALLDDYKFLLPKIDTIFSRDDLDYIKQQYENEGRLLLNKEKIKGKNFIKVDSLLNAKFTSNRWEDYEELNKEFRCYSTIRIPVFNKSKDMAIVEVEYSCGLECAEKGIFIYKKNKEGKWELYLTLERLIS